MSCGSLSGYTIGCGGFQAGVEEIYITELANISSLVSASGAVTTLTQVANTHFYTYEQEINRAFANDNPIGNRNGTFYSDQTVTIFLPKRAAAVSYDIKLMGSMKVAVLVKERTGKYMLYGALNGLRLDASSTSGTGTNMGDDNGYVIVLKGQEAELALEVSSSIFSGLSIV